LSRKFSGTAEGGRKAPNLRAEEVQQATPGTLFWILTNGVVRRGMPVWSKLPAKLFAKNGWNVVATMRMPEAERDLLYVRESDNILSWVAGRTEVVLDASHNNQRRPFA